MNKNELEQVMRAERRRQSKRAVLIVLSLIGFAIFLMIVNKACDSDPVMDRRRATTTQTTP